MMLINRDNISLCLEAYEKHPPFSGDARKYHVQTIQKRRELGSAEAALSDLSFLQSLHKTIQKWGIGKRGSVLKSFDDFVSALQANVADIRDLDGLMIDQPILDVSVPSKLSRLVQTLDIVDSKVKIVAGSKALHHLLPELVVPIDREYTLKIFFDRSMPSSQSAQERFFVEAFNAFVDIARDTNPAQYVKDGVHTSRTKVIDNAIIGLWLRFVNERGK